MQSTPEKSCRFLHPAVNDQRGAGAPSNTRVARQGLLWRKPPRKACAKLPPDAKFNKGIRSAGGSEMANRLPLTVTFVLSVLLVSGLTAAHAADPGFCKQYSQAALTQVRLGLANPRCAGGLQGARWSADFAVHYQWCLGASFGAAGTERDARTQYLRGCR